MMLTKNLLTVPEVAERLRCSRWGVYAMAKDGRLASVRLSSRRLLFTEAAVDEAVRHSAAPSGSGHLPHLAEAQQANSERILQLLLGRPGG
jgi:excisionase family DNA binding protein